MKILRWSYHDSCVVTFIFTVAFDKQMYSTLCKATHFYLELQQYIKSTASDKGCERKPNRAVTADQHTVWVHTTGEHSPYKQSHTSWNVRRQWITHRHTHWVEHWDQILTSVCLSLLFLKFKGTEEEEFRCKCRVNVFLTTEFFWQKINK